MTIWSRIPEKELIPIASAITIAAEIRENPDGIRTLVQTGLNRVIGRKTMPLRHWASAHREEMLNGELVSGAEAVRLAGVSHAMLRLLEGDSVGVALGTGHRRGGRFYNIQALTASVALWRNGLRRREVVKSLGAPEFALHISGDDGENRADHRAGCIERRTRLILPQSPGFDLA